MENTQTTRYVDGYVLPVPKDKLDHYKQLAAEAGKAWMKHGALQYVESVGEDLNPDMGDMEILTFPKLANVEPDETVIFAFIVYKSRKHRDEVNAKVMKEMEEKGEEDMDMPFDMKRMAYGGFKTIVSL